MPRPSPDPSPLHPASETGRWRVRLLGTLEAARGDVVLRRWPSRAIATLLARLALAPQRSHPREELIELLWPGVALDVGRNRLRQALSTLRALLEDPHGSSTSVIESDRNQLRVQPGALPCDALDFERAVQGGDWAAARALYAGELMPGHYDDWVVDERRRLAALFDRVEAAPPPRAPARPVAESRLPAAWTRAFGLEHTATRLLTTLRHNRLVTVVGPGGCGKTRLALEAARALRDPPLPELQMSAQPAFAQVLFLPLVDALDDTQAIGSLASLLGADGRDPLPDATARLADVPTALVLDNLEQLVPGGIGWVMQLLEGAPRLHLVVTSRVRLGLPGEQVFTLGGLPLPDIATTRSIDEALLNPAVALFVDRARGVRPDFDPRPAGLPELCQLLHQLDGMPLAVELAASRIGSFSPGEMLRLLTQAGGSRPHLHLLARSGPRSGFDARHGSIEAVIDWSWRLLSSAEQRLMQALAECAGDAGLPMLAAASGEEPAAAAARLDDLVGHSMATVRPEGPRYAMLEPVREFVRHRSPPEARRAVRLAMLQWLLDWARGLGPRASSPAVNAEVRTVHALLVDASLPARPRLELALSLRPYWDSAGLASGIQLELVRALDQVLADGLEPERDALGSDVHEMLAYQRFEAGFSAEAVSHAEAALRLAGTDAPRRARALVRRAWVELAGHRDDVDAGPQVQRLDRDLAEALDLAVQAGDREAQARALHQRAALISQMGGEWARAEGLLERSQALWTELGDQRKASSRLRNRAQCWVRMGRLDDALACLERCEREARDDDDWLGQIDSLLSLSTVHASLRRWAEALDFDRRCVALCWQRWHRHGLAYAIWNPPLSLARLRRPEAAARLMAFAGRHWATQFGPLSRADRHTLRRVRRLVRAQVGEARTEALWREGEALSLAQAVALVIGD